LQRLPCYLLFISFILKASTSEVKKWRNYRQDKGEERETLLLGGKVGNGGQAGGQ
jgi:hypothetical protein